MICEACEQPVRATGPRVYADDMSKVWHYRCHPTVAASPPGLSPGIASCRTCGRWGPILSCARCHGCHGGAYGYGYACLATAACRGAEPDIQTREAQRAEIRDMYRVREEDL